MHNRIFIYNIIYVLIHILCYVVFITKMFEIKQNELCTHVCIIYPELTSTTLFLSVKPDFLIKNILHFWTMCKYQKPLWYGGILHFKKICQCCQKGNVFYSHPPLNFQPPDHFPKLPKIPPKIPKNHSITTSTHLRKVFYFQPFSTP